MQSVTYHYIKKRKNSEYPNAHFLKSDKFNRQLNFFEKNGGIIQKEDNIFKNNNKFLLTFDDGLKEHLFAAKELYKRGKKGIFFISAFPYLKKDILPVHKVHIILSKVGGYKAYKKLMSFLKTYKNKSLFNDKVKNKFKKIYDSQNDDYYEKEFKKIINYYSDLELRVKILNYLIKEFKIKTSVSKYYLSKNEIKYILNLGMIIGSHSVSHPVLSKLSFNEQLLELKQSKLFLEKITKKKIDLFCYPYGSKKSYNSITIKLLKKLGYKFAFSVEHKNISFAKIKKKPYELPRYDCNYFRF